MIKKCNGKKSIFCVTDSMLNRICTYVLLFVIATTVRVIRRSNGKRKIDYRVPASDRERRGTCCSLELKVSPLQ